MSKIIPIFKADDETEPNNYRPISLLSNFNRIFEKLMYKRIPPSLASEEVVRANAQASGRPSGRWPTKDPHFCILKADVTKDQQGTSG